MEIRKVELSDMLARREKRAARQKELIERFRQPVVSISMNIAGDIKNTPAISLMCAEGAESFSRSLGGKKLLCCEITDGFTGPERLLVFDEADAHSLKAAGIAAEEALPWSRLLDIDVIGTDGEKLSRERARRCIVCGGPAADCARSRAHGLEAVKRAADGLTASYVADMLAARAEYALVKEARLTPKPGLVDSEGSGSHGDMDLPLLIRSAAVLRPFFAEMARETALSGPDAERLAQIGISAEKAMLGACGGVNTHRGAIFALSLYAAAFAEYFMRCTPVLKTVRELARAKAESSSREGAARTHGALVRASYGTKGPVELAGECFPEALCAARLLREGRSPLHALCRIMSSLPDGNVLYRGGPQGLEWLRSRAAALCALPDGELPGALAEFGAECVGRNLSPGGAADMLALAFYIAEMPFYADISEDME